MNESMPRQTLAEAEAQAHEIEGAGKDASARVKRGLFMSAANLAELQRQAYKEGMHNKTSSIKADESWNDLMNPTFDDDEWDPGANSGYR